ncbi:MAG: DUF1934 domain-containing protein [Clostridia bacterium]|nr:DUF1934 domain-containing protein [Clostridia bacterium]
MSESNNNKSNNIKMKIRSLRYEVEESLFARLAYESELDFDESDDAPAEYNEEEAIELSTEGIMKIADGRVELLYEESEITGMEGSQTSVIFDLASPGLVSMIRNGSVSTALVFEKGKRHHCVYNTPIMPFEICVRTIKVENDILDQGRLRLDYVIEIRGAKAERTKFELDIIAK